MVRRKIAEAEVKDPKKPGRKNEVDLGSLQTEDIWALYHKARAKKQAAELEKLRNALLERHQPLVRLDALGEALLRQVGATHVHVSLSHTETMAMAVAALVRA